MTPSEARKLILQIAKVTEQVFRENDGINQVFHFGGDHGFTSLIVPDEYMDNKDMVATVIRKALEIDDAKWVMMVSEAWTSHVDEGAPYIQPRNDPNRNEVIIYMLEDEDLQMIDAEQEIIRPKGKKPYLGELKIRGKVKEIGGRFVGLLPRRKMSS